MADKEDLSFLATPGRYVDIIIRKSQTEESHYHTCILDWNRKLCELTLAAIPDDKFQKLAQQPQNVRLEFASHQRLYSVQCQLRGLGDRHVVLVETDLLGGFTERRTYVRVNLQALITLYKEDGSVHYSLSAPRPISLSATGLGFNTANTNFYRDDQFRTEIIAEASDGREFICDTLVRLTRIDKLDEQIAIHSEQMYFGYEPIPHISAGFEFVDMDEDLINELAKFVVQKLEA